MSSQTNAEKCFDLLSTATQSLKMEASEEYLEFITEILLQSMGGPRRSFHTLTHIFNICKSKDPIEVIAGLFHDVIYVQVDQAIILNVGRFINPYIEERHHKLFISQSISPDQDPIFKLVLDIFGFTPGAELQPLAGQNEFLSALLASKVFEKIAPLPLLAKIAACIEATIPFRPVANNTSCSDNLFARLSKLNQELNLGLSPEDLTECVKRSVRLSNRDVENFSNEQSSQFLDETWNLLPETNHDLIRANTYTVKQYRVSLQKMEGFLNFLSPKLVFREFQGEPGKEQFERLNARAAHNIEIARLYLGMKLTSIGILEALSLRLGNDVSISMMMGELPSEDRNQKTMASFLPSIQIAAPLVTEKEKEVMSLLADGRYLNSVYDLKNSPTAAFMVNAIGFDKMQLLLQSVKRFFNGEITSEELIEECPRFIIDAITKSILCLFDLRKQYLV